MKKEFTKSLLNNLDFTQSNKQLEELKAQIFNSTLSPNEKVSLMQKELAQKKYKISDKSIANALIEEFHFELMNESEMA